MGLFIFVHYFGFLFFGFSMHFHHFLCTIITAAFIKNTDDTLRLLYSFFFNVHECLHTLYHSLHHRYCTSSLLLAFFEIGIRLIFLLLPKQSKEIQGKYLLHSMLRKRQTHVVPNVKFFMSLRMMVYCGVTCCDYQHNVCCQNVMPKVHHN